MTMKKYSSTAAFILATSSPSSDATRQAEGAVAAAIGREHDIIRSSSSTVLTTTTVAPVYAGYYCMGCDDYWKRRNNNDGNSSLSKNKELVSAAIKKLGRAVVQNRSSSSQRKRFKENSANVALIESNTVDTAANPLPIQFDVDVISLAAEERSPTLDKDHPPTRQEDNDIYVPSALQRQPVESTCNSDLTVSNTIGADDNDIVLSLLKENQLLKERLELLREIELREKIDLLRIGLSNALNEHGLSSSSSLSSDTEEESHHILMEQEVLINILQSNEQREKQLFYQMSITVFLVGSLLVAVIYIHNKQLNDTKEEQQVTTEGLTDLIIPSMCPISPTESLGSITEEGVGVLGITSSSNQLSLQEENKMLRNQLDLMRTIGPTNGVIHEDQEYDGSVLSDASISVDYSNRMRWWRFGIRPQLSHQKQQQQRSIVKGLDRVKADEAAKDVSLSNQHDNAAVDINDKDLVSQPPQPRWGWGRRKIDDNVVSSKRSRANDDKSNDDDRSQVSLSSMGIAASIDYQLKKMSESC